MRHLLRAGCLASLGALAVAAAPAAAVATVSPEVMIGQVFITRIVGTSCGAAVGNNFTLTFQPPKAKTDVIRFSFLGGKSGATLVQTTPSSSILQENFVRLDNGGPGVDTVSFSGYSFKRSTQFPDSGEFTIILTFSSSCRESWRGALTDWAGVSQ